MHTFLHFLFFWLYSEPANEAPKPGPKHPIVIFVDRPTDLGHEE
jgi:hypothetical protein